MVVELFDNCNSLILQDLLLAALKQYSYMLRAYSAVYKYLIQWETNGRRSYV